MYTIEIRLTEEEILELLFAVELKLNVIRGYATKSEHCLQVTKIKLTDAYKQLIKHKRNHGTNENQ